MLALSNKSQATRLLMAFLLELELLLQRQSAILRIRSHERLLLQLPARDVSVLQRIVAFRFQLLQRVHLYEGKNSQWKLFTFTSSVIFLLSVSSVSLRSRKYRSEERSESTCFSARSSAGSTCFRLQQGKTFRKSSHTKRTHRSLNSFSSALIPSLRMRSSDASRALLSSALRRSSISCRYRSSSALRSRLSISSDSLIVRFRRLFSFSSERTRCIQRGGDERTLTEGSYSATHIDVTSETIVQMRQLLLLLHTRPAARR